MAALREALHGVFREFERLLQVRFDASVHTTEDVVRYTFFHALMTQTSLRPHDVLLESPHPQVPRAKIDTVIPSFEGKSIAMEFKYDREIPSGTNAPRPLKIGQVFKDIARLAKYSADGSVDRLLVYCTSGEMANYLRNPRNRHSDFFGLPLGKSLRVDQEYVSARQETFQKAIGGAPLADIVCIWTSHLPNDHELRVFEIVPL